MTNFSTPASSSGRMRRLAAKTKQNTIRAPVGLSDWTPRLGGRRIQDAPQP